MVRRSSFVIGLGLALLWGIGLRLSPHASMLWFDAVAAVIAFSIAVLVDDTVEHDPANAFGPALLGLGLAALWIVGVASRQPAWVAWVHFRSRSPASAVAVMTAGTRHVEVGSRARTYRVTITRATCGRRRRPTACGNPRRRSCPPGCRTRTGRARRPRR